jgi:hypothetical protein
LPETSTTIVAGALGIAALGASETIGLGTDALPWESVKKSEPTAIDVARTM